MQLNYHILSPSFVEILLELSSHDYPISLRTFEVQYRYTLMIDDLSSLYLTSHIGLPTFIPRGRGYS